MECLDLTLATPAENLAADEALLDLCDSGELGEILRFWESRTHFAVAGYGNHVDREINVGACADSQIPVLRRCSGGGSVLQGPGCLNYALVLRIDRRPEMESISSTNCQIMSKHRAALRSLGWPVEISGHTDLVLGGSPVLKFSGNSQRRKRAALLFHGTFLYNFDLKLLGQTLKFPTQQPDYRQGRSHADFVTNYPASVTTLKKAIRSVWDAGLNFGEPATVIAAAKELARSKYGLSAWNRKL